MKDVKLQEIDDLLEEELNRNTEEIKISEKEIAQLPASPKFTGERQSETRKEKIRKSNGSLRGSGDSFNFSNKSGEDT